MNPTVHVPLQTLAVMTNSELAALYTDANAQLEIARQSNTTLETVDALEHNAANSLDILLGRMDRMAHSAVLRVKATHESLTVDELMDGYVQDMVSLYTVHPEAWDTNDTLSQDTPADTFSLYGGMAQFGAEHRDGYLTVLLDRLNSAAQQQVEDAGYTVE